MSGVLVVTRAAGLLEEYKGRLEKLGFHDVTITDKENCALNTVICNKKPRLALIDSWFYQDATPCRIGELVKMFPKLNIGVFSVHDFPASRAVTVSGKAQIHTLACGMGMMNFSGACGLCGREGGISRRRFKN
jgi:hypothetical protein